MKARILVRASKEVFHDVSFWMLILILLLCGMDGNIGFKIVSIWFATFLVLCVMIQSSIIKDRDNKSK